MLAKVDPPLLFPLIDADAQMDERGRKSTAMVRPCDTSSGTEPETTFEMTMNMMAGSVCISHVSTWADVGKGSANLV